MYHPCYSEYTMPKIIKEKSIFKSRLFNIKQAQIEFNHQILEYEIISGTGQGAVIIVPIIDDEIIFIREYAAAVDDYMITLPKGKIDKGEELIETANRELQEEVGFKSDNIKLINKIYLAPGYIDHITYLDCSKVLVDFTLIYFDTKTWSVWSYYVTVNDWYRVLNNIIC